MPTEPDTRGARGAGRTEGKDFLLVIVAKERLVLSFLINGKAHRQVVPGKVSLDSSWVVWRSVCCTFGAQAAVA